MADGRRIVANIEKIRVQVGHTPIVFKTTAPVCSKTKIFLAKQGITVIFQK